jgi:hypothetical protein
MTEAGIPKKLKTMRINMHKKATHRVAFDICTSHKVTGKTAMASRLKNLGLKAE